MKKITSTILMTMLLVISNSYQLKAQSAFSCPATGSPICNCDATDSWGAQVEVMQAFDYSSTFGLLGSVLPYDIDSDSDGQWSGTVDKNWGLVPAHAVLTPKGKVLSFGTGVTEADSGLGDRGNGNGDYEMMFHLYDPVTQQGEILETLIQTDLFCAAAAIVPQTGQILITGGDTNYDNAAYDDRSYQGIVQSNIYDPNKEAIDADPFGNMEYARWYPTVATLGDGSVLVVGGRDEFGEGVGPSELYVPGEGYRTLTGTSFEELLELYWYPRVHQLANGLVLVVLQDNVNQGGALPTKNENEGLWLMDISGEGSVTKIGEKPFIMGVGEPSAQIGEDLFLFMDVTGKLWTLNMASGTPDWAEVGQFSQRLAWSNMCLMPDGDVMISGGSATDNKLVDVNFDTFLWNRTTHDIKNIAAQSEERLYHSSTVLLHDGTIMSLGGGAPGPILQNNVEMFRPPYLFDSSGNYVEDRFEILEYSTSIHPGEEIGVTIDAGVDVSKVTLLKHSATTHSVNMGAKFLEPEWSQEGDTLTIKTNTNFNVFLPGAWMIFVFDENGVPAIAKTVHVGVPVDSDITANEDENFTGTGNGNDRIIGTPNKDVIDAGFGNDEVYGEADNDVIIGGFGYDVLYGGEGDDYIFGKPLPVPVPDYYFRVDEGADDFAAAAGFNFSHENAYKFFLGSSNEWTRTGAFDGRTAVAFNGGSSGGGMQLGNSLTLGEGVSVSAFVRFDNLEEGNWQRVFDFSNGGLSNNILLSQFKNTNDISFQIYENGSKVGDLFVEDVIVQGEWASWTTTVSESGTMALYKNGILIGEAAGQAPSLVSREELYLGDSPVSNDTTLHGAISNVAIFNQGLNSDQVAVIYGQILDSEPLVGFLDGNDLLSGNNGNDILDGGAGNDEMFGGEGNDTFVFSDTTFGYDTVNDWDVGDNRIVFTDPSMDYSKLNITQEESGVGISIEGVEESYIALVGATLEDFSEEDFIFDSDFYDLSSIVDLSDFYRDINEVPTIEMEPVEGITLELSGGLEEGMLLDPMILGGATIIAADVRFDDLVNGNWQRVFDFSNGTSSNNIMLTQIENTNGIRFQIFHDGQLRSTLDVENVIVEEEWATWTASVSSFGEMKLYKDNVLVGNATGQALETLERTVNYLGDSPWENDTTLNGAIKNVIISSNGLVENLYPLVVPDTSILDTSIHYFSLDEDTDSIFLDEMESNVIGDLGSGVWTEGSGINGLPAAELTGGTSEGLSLSSLDIGGAITIATYVRFDDINNGLWQRIFDFSNGTSSNNILLSQLRGTNGIRFQIFHDNSVVSTLDVEDVIDEGEWALWTASISETGVMAVYKNGVLIGTATGQPLETITRTVNYLGDSPWTHDNTLDGAISHVSIFDYVLNTEEILELVIEEASVSNSNESRALTASFVTSNPTSFDIYPNPTSNVISLDYQIGNAKKGTIQLFNLSTGKLEKSYEVDLKNGHNHYDLNIEDIPSGLYYLMDSGVLGQKVIIK